MTQSDGRERRHFMRHPIHVPIAVHVSHAGDPHRSEAMDLSQGGLSFLWKRKLPNGRDLNIDIPVKEKHFKIKARVVYCAADKKTGFFRTGVSFLDVTSAFRAKLAEEALEIMAYRKKISRETGHPVSEEKAAEEWIKKYAEFFFEI